MSHFKVLALDLDGTVLSNAHTISPALKATINRIKPFVKVLIVTGRHHTAAQPFHEELGLTTPIICCNGTYQYHYGEQNVVNSNEIDPDIAHQFLDLANEHNMNVAMYVTKAMLFNPEKPAVYMKDMTQWAQSYPEGKQPQILAEPNFHNAISNAEHVWKFVIEGDHTDHFAELAFIKEHFNGERSWHNRLDFARKGNQKGHALADYVHSLNLTAADVMAAGDNHNDISMLNYAGLGVAMSQADARVKAAAQKISYADNNTETGLSSTIDDLIGC